MQIEFPWTTHAINVITDEELITDALTSKKN